MSNNEVKFKVLLLEEVVGEETNIEYRDYFFSDSDDYSGLGTAATVCSSCDSVCIRSKREADLCSELDYNTKTKKGYIHKETGDTVRV